MCNFADAKSYDDGRYVEYSRKVKFTKYIITMQLETINLKSSNLIPSHTISDGMRIRQSGIAKVLWRKLDTDVPESEVIVGGVDIFKD